jgi:DNA (cytosine-5)-methyltransferase 1
MRNGTVRPGFENMPLLNVRMAARLQGFPDEWHFVGAKTHAYRQVGNAFPPPVAKAVGEKIAQAIRDYELEQKLVANARTETKKAKQRALAA